MASVRQQVFSEYVLELTSALDDRVLDELDQAAHLLEAAFHAGKKVFIAGNGGSAATASHMMADLQKTTMGKEVGVEKRFRAIALSDNVPVLTAWANDFGYDLVFSQQMRCLADEGDVLIAISASGNSPNIVEALSAAKELGVRSIGFLGFEGGKAKGMCDVPIVVASKNYGVIEDAHSVFMHMVTAAFKELVQGV